MNISRNGSITTLKLINAEVAALQKAEEIARTVAFVRRQDPPNNGLLSLLDDIGEDQTITVEK